MNINTISINFLNNIGGGYAETLTVDAGTRLVDLVRNKISFDRKSYSVRVNSQPKTDDYVLQNNDLVSILPVKITGALAA